jgi:hypothetical protein
LTVERPRATSAAVRQISISDTSRVDAKLRRGANPFRQPSSARRSRRTALYVGLPLTFFFPVLCHAFLLCRPPFVQCGQYSCCYSGGGGGGGGGGSGGHHPAPVCRRCPCKRSCKTDISACKAIDLDPWSPGVPPAKLRKLCKKEILAGCVEQQGCGSRGLLYTSAADRLTSLHDRVPDAGHLLLRIPVEAVTPNLRTPGDFVLAFDGQFLHPFVPEFPGHPGFVGPYCDGAAAGCELVFEVPTTPPTSPPRLFYRARNQPSYGAMLADAVSNVAINPTARPPTPRTFLIASHVEASPLEGNPLYTDQACVTFDVIAVDGAVVEVSSLRAPSSEGGLILVFSSAFPKAYANTSISCSVEDPIISGTFRTCVGCFEYRPESPAASLWFGAVHTYVTFPERYGSFPVDGH